jgi:hypothetical protein
MQQEPISISALFKQMLTKSPHQVKLKEAAIICAWKNIMPAILTHHTQKIFVRKHQLFLQINSAPLRQEIQTAKGKLLEKLAAEVPDYVVKDIVWL